MTTAQRAARGATERFTAPMHAAWDSDLALSLRASPLVMAAALTLLVLVVAAAAASLVAPHDPYDPLQVELMDAFTPPYWTADGQPAYLLGTDNQGRDILSAILYGLRTSLLIGLAAVGLALVVGVGLGLLAGFVGGRLDSLIMRAADVQLTFPSILVALIVDGLLRSFLGSAAKAELGLVVVILSIAAANWVRFARTVRACTLVERTREYVQAARLLGRGPVYITLRHILPNVSGPIVVIATVDLGVAMLQEATLSFLGVGMPPDQPSLGTLVETGRNYLISGEWWIAFLPGLALAMLVLSVNIVGDWLRDALNPRLH